MSNKKEEIDLDINTELSDDEFEEYDETLSEDENETEVVNEDDNEDDNEDETMQESEMEEIEDIDESKNKSNFEDSISKSEIDKDISDTFLDDDLDDLEDEIEFVNPDDEMNENLQVNDEDRISRNILTKYEMVRLIGTRAKQISDGSKVFVKYDGEKSAIELAELEIKYKMLPLKIKRPLPNGKYEIWKVSELDILDNF